MKRFATLFATLPFFYFVAAYGRTLPNGTRYLTLSHAYDTQAECDAGAAYAANLGEEPSVCYDSTVVPAP